VSTWNRALVTGATGGLGEAFARELARSGTELVIVGRNGDRLADLAADLGSGGGRPVEVLVADLADLSPDGGLETVCRRLATVDLLVHCAGASGRIAPLALLTPAEQAGGIDLTVTATTRLVAAALPGMAARRHGGVLVVSSMMGFLHAPGGSVYCAGKAFVTSLTRTASAEVRPLGVTVTAVCPGSVRTGLHRVSGARSRLGPPLAPAFVARRGLSGLAAGRTVVVPGAAYRWRAALARHAPRRLVDRWFFGAWADDAAHRLAVAPEPQEAR
jgi:uncharacterized protein